MPSPAGGSVAAAVALVIVGQVAVDTGGIAGFAGGNGAAAVAVLAAVALLAPRLGGAARALKRGASRAGGWARRGGGGKPPAAPCLATTGGPGDGGASSVAGGRGSPPDGGAASAEGAAAVVAEAALLPSPAPSVLDDEVLTAATILTMEDYTTAEEGDGSSVRRGRGGCRGGRRCHRGRGRRERWGGAAQLLPPLRPLSPPPQGWRSVYASCVASRPAWAAGVAAPSRGPALPKSSPPLPPTPPSFTDSASGSAGSTAWATAGVGERQLPARPRLPRRPRAPRGRPRHVCVEV